jgi:hypothetical protein
VISFIENNNGTTNNDDINMIWLMRTIAGIDNVQAHTISDVRVINEVVKHYNKLRPKRVLLDSQYTAKLSLIPFTTGTGVGPKLSDTEYSSYNEVNIQNEKKKK